MEAGHDREDRETSREDTLGDMWRAELNTGWMVLNRRACQNRRQGVNYVSNETIFMPCKSMR